MNNHQTQAYDNAKNKMETYLKTCEKKVADKEKENVLIKNKIIDLLKKGDKDVARKFLKRKKKNEELILMLEKRMAMMEKQLTSLEDMQTTTEFIGVIQDTNKAIKKNKVNADDAMDVIKHASELKDMARSENEQLEGLLEDDLEDDDDIADMMKEYEDQVNEDMKKGFEHADKYIIDKDPSKEKPKPSQKDNVKPAKKEDFDDMLSKMMQN